MKMLLVAVILVLMTATMAWANPFCECTKGIGGLPTAYNIEGLGAFLPVTTAIPAQSDGNFRLDLANLPTGSYTIRVRALNLSGVSEWSDPLAFTLPGQPGKPMVPRLSAQ